MDARLSRHMEKNAKDAHTLHQRLKVLFGNRKSSAHSKSNMNEELKLVAGHASPFITDTGCRFRVQAKNAESFLLEEETVKKTIEVGQSDQAKSLNDLLSGPNANKTIVEASFPLLMYRSVMFLLLYL